MTDIKFWIIVVLLIFIFLLIVDIYKLNSINKSLLEINDGRKEIIEAYKTETEKWSDFEKEIEELEKGYNEIISIYKDIKQKDDKIIKLMDEEINSLKEKHQNLLDAYNKQIQ